MVLYTLVHRAHLRIIRRILNRDTGGEFCSCSFPQLFQVNAQTRCEKSIPSDCSVILLSVPHSALY